MPPGWTGGHRRRSRHNGVMRPRIPAGHAATTYGKFPVRRRSETDGDRPEVTAVRGPATTSLPVRCRPASGRCGPRTRMSPAFRPRRTGRRGTAPGPRSARSQAGHVTFRWPRRRRRRGRRCAYPRPRISEGCRVVSGDSRSCVVGPRDRPHLGWPARGSAATRRRRWRVSWHTRRRMRTGVQPRVLVGDL